ncbi:MAG: CPBP family intramembrane glutamic endopeptidase [Patescibacteria group bacterium]
MTDISTLLSLKQIWILSPLAQIVIMVVLYIITGFTQLPFYKKTGKLFYNYPPNSFLIFAPIYEEVIFRGILLVTFTNLYGLVWAIILQSVLFGLWHLRSLLFMSPKRVTIQVLYTGLILGPLFAIITIWAGTIWIAVILHFLNNFLACVTHRESQELLSAPK